MLKTSLNSFKRKLLVLSSLCEELSSGCRLYSARNPQEFPPEPSNNALENVTSINPNPNLNILYRARFQNIGIRVVGKMGLLVLSMH